MAETHPGAEHAEGGFNLKKNLLVALTIPLRKLGFPVRVYDYETGGERPETRLAVQLRPLLNLNHRMCEELSNISEYYGAAEKRKEHIEHMYRNLGPYTDFNRIYAEVEYMKKGTGTVIPEIIVEKMVIKFKAIKPFVIKLSNNVIHNITTFDELVTHLTGTNGEEIFRFLKTNNKIFQTWLLDPTTTSHLDKKARAAILAKLDEDKIKFLEILYITKLKLVKKLSVKKKTLYHYDATKPEYKEDNFSAFGYEYRLKDITPKLKAITASLEDIRDADMQAKVAGVFKQSVDAFTALFEAVKTTESSYHNIMNEWLGVLRQLEQEKKQLMHPDNMPKFVHFKHTYMVTSPYFLPYEGEEHGDAHPGHAETQTSHDTTNTTPANETQRQEPAVGEINTFAQAHQNFKREEEYAPGLDKRGMPLEVYTEEERGTKRYYVLIDNWIWKTAQNEWQLKQIAEKLTKDEFLELFNGRAEFSGSFTFLDGEHSVRCSLKPNYNGGKGREVKQEFARDIDLLEVVNYIFIAWDAYRDDFRDGRYHPNSKSINDYIIAAQPYNLLTRKDRHTWERSMPSTAMKQGEHVPVWKSDSFERVPVHPEWDSKMPADEQKITAGYKMKIFNPKTGVLEIFDGKRRPTHLNPAFDRAATAWPQMSTEPTGQTKGGSWIHYGTLYYYDDANAINELAENPDPALSTRGLGKYLVDTVLRLGGTFEEQQKTLDRSPLYDLGVRSQKQSMRMNPLRDLALRYGAYKQATGGTKAPGHD